MFGIIMIKCFAVNLVVSSKHTLYIATKGLPNFLAFGTKRSLVLWYQMNCIKSVFSLFIVVQQLDGQRFR